MIVSNRGPLSFEQHDGALAARRGAGGLVSGLAPLVAGTDTTWVAAALSEGDREAARHGVTEAEDFRVRLLDLDPAQFRMAYDVICNATLWFVHHGLFDASRRPVIDSRWHEAWQAYVAVNEAFADAVAESAPPDAVVLVQDYHLCLLAPRLARRRGDLTAIHFSHTPFTGPDGLRQLPDDAAHALLEGMATHQACGFHTERWARNFRRCCAEVLGSEPVTFATSLAPHPDDLAATLGRPETATAATDLDEVVGDRHLLVRVDRIELSKNLLRGFRAFDDLLTRYPQWQEQVVFGAFIYPSREGLPEYLAYRQEVEASIELLNERWGTPGWTPIVADLRDDFPRSVAALARYDALLVNPIRDGLNLVAKEGPLVNDRDGVVVLSTEAGVAEELGDAPLRVNPFDVTQTADALHRALSMPSSERTERAGRLRALAEAHGPGDWLEAQRQASERSSNASRNG